jgi:hypothetical protein
VVRPLIRRYSCLGTSTLEQVASTCCEGWSAETRDRVDLPKWSEANRARDNDGVTALIVHDPLGGEVLLAEAASTSHLPKVAMVQRTHSSTFGSPPATLVGDRPTCTTVLAANDLTPMAARVFTRAVLDDWDVIAAYDDTVLLVDELVTNAVVHATSTVTLALTVSSYLVHIEVSDHCTNLPIQAPRSDERTGGRGLTLVAALAHEWGTHRHTVHGKTVWADVVVGMSPARTQTGSAFSVVADHRAADADPDDVGEAGVADQ